MGELYAKFDPNLWAQISAVIFLCGFIALVLWLYWPGQQKRYSKAERLPFEEEGYDQEKR